MLTEKEQRLIRQFYFVCGSSNISHMLENFANGCGHSEEMIGCSFASDFEKDEEGYFADTGVEYSLDPPAVDERISVIVDYPTFFKQLTDACENYCTQHPERREYVKEKLATIKKNLNF
jgi:hypothetical protein